MSFRYAGSKVLSPAFTLSLASISPSARSPGTTSEETGAGELPVVGEALHAMAITAAASAAAVIKCRLRIRCLPYIYRRTNRDFARAQD